MDRLRRFWYSLPLKVRDVVVRAAKTFAQVFISGVPLAVLATGDTHLIWVTVLGAGSAAVSAAWNVIKTPSSGEAILVPFPVKAADDLLPPKE